MFSILPGVCVRVARSCLKPCNLRNSAALILKNACIVLATRCIAGIKANRERCRQYVEKSIGLVTALNPVLGYEKSVAVAKEALESGRSVYELTMEKGWLSKEALDDILSPENMTHPRQVPMTQGK